MTNESHLFAGLDDDQMWEQAQKMAYRLAQSEYRVLSKKPGPVIRVRDGDRVKSLYATWCSAFRFDGNGNVCGMYGDLKLGSPHLDEHLDNDPSTDHLLFILSKRNGGGIISHRFNRIKYAA